MRFFIYVMLLQNVFIKYCSTNYILCTSKCNQINTPFLQSFQIPDECQFNTTNNHIYDYALMCIIDYRIDYDAKYIYINFKSSNDSYMSERHNHSEFLSQTIWLDFTEELYQPTITHRKYQCNIKADCAREFYFHTIEHLITNGQLQLEQIKSKLHQKSIPINRAVNRRCKINNRINNQTTIQCRDGLCYVNTMNKKQYCTNDKSAMLFSELEYYSPNTKYNETELIEYKCNKHLCNRNEIVEIIKNILRNYTNWNDKKQDDSEIINRKSSANIHQTISFSLFILSLINLQFSF